MPSRSLQMPVQTVKAHIKFSTHEPLRKRRFPLQGLFWLRKPSQFLFSNPTPEFFRLLQRLLMHRLITRRNAEGSLLHKAGGGFVLFWMFHPTLFSPFFLRPYRSPQQFPLQAPFGQDPRLRKLTDPPLAQPTLPPVAPATSRSTVSLHASTCSYS